jgi:hypothetical protein
MARTVAQADAKYPTDIIDWPICATVLLGPQTPEDVDGNGGPLSGLLTGLFSVGASFAVELWLAESSSVVWGEGSARIAGTGEGILQSKRGLDQYFLEKF